MDTKKKIIELLLSTERKGIESMIKYLTESGFFESPTSTRFHSAYAGGLAEHSLAVYNLLIKLCPNNICDAIGVGQEPLICGSLIIAALLHDVCKIGAYIGTENPYKWNKQHPKGHAILSLERIKEHIVLTGIEELMIKYHMGVYGLNEFYRDGQGEYPLRSDESLSKEERRNKSLANVWYHNPIVKVMYFCDELATLGGKAE